MSDTADETEQSAGFPVDLGIVGLLAVVVGFSAVYPAMSASSVGTLIAIVAVFLPGYSLVAALFPRGPPTETVSEQVFAQRIHRLDGFDRTVLSVAVGLVVTPLLGIGVSFSPWPLQYTPLATTVVGFVMLTAGIAAVRRRRVPRGERYAPTRRWSRAVSRTVYGPVDTSGIPPITVVVGVAVLVAIGGVLFVAGTAETGESFTEFAVMTETADGGLVAAAYPENTTAGSAVSVVLRIDNRERTDRRYTVVPIVQRMVDVDGQTRIDEQDIGDSVSATVQRGGQERVDLTVTPTLTGKNLRVVFLLYQGEPPAQPTTANAYRRTHLWVTVSGQDPPRENGGSTT